MSNIIKQKRGAALVARNKEEVMKRSVKIEQILKVLGRAKFKHVTELSQHVARRLTEIEGKACSESSLRRNDIYRALLDDYMDSITGKKVKKKDEIDGSVTLRLQLKIRELKKENSAFEKQLAVAFEKVVQLESIIDDSAIERTDKNASKNINTNIDKYIFVLNKVISLVDSIGVDIQKGEVIDEMIMKPVFTRKDLPEFFDWYERLSK